MVLGFDDAIGCGAFAWDVARGEKRDVSGLCGEMLELEEGRTDRRSRPFRFPFWRIEEVSCVCEVRKT